MSALLFASPVLRPLTIAGAIMPGAYVQFYASGTTTPVDVYSDADLTTPLSNPVVADDDGEFAPIYLDRSVSYRAQLYDADDNLIWDVDPIGGTNVDYPPGTVVMFFGDEEARDEAYPPSEWAVCDGTNGTPDMAGRVPLGMDSGLTPGDTGGSSSAATTSSAGAHNHTGTTGSTTLTTNQIPAHRHGMRFSAGATNIVIYNSASAEGLGAFDGTGVDDVTAFGGGDNVMATAGGGQGHTHSIGEDGAHTHTVSVTPPYCVLWFLMRKSA